MGSGIFLDACTTAFNQLRRVFTDASVLAYLVLPPFVLDTDASNKWLGTVLS